MSERYIIDTIHAKSLENNPLGSPVERDLNIFLPPDYFLHKTKRYPVIYLLHGYGGSNKNWVLTWNGNENKSFELGKLMGKIELQSDLVNPLYFEKLDQLIGEGILKPFILAQWKRNHWLGR